MTVAAGQAQQGAWTRWELMQERMISWGDLCRAELMRISFMLRSVYHFLPTLVNLAHWSDEKSDLCPSCKGYGPCSTYSAPAQMP